MADADGGWQRVGVNGGGFSSPSNPRATLLLARSPSVRRRSDMRPPTDSGLCPCTRTRERVRSTDGTSELGIVATWPRLLGEACVNEGRADTCGGSALSAPFWRGESLQRYSDAVVFVVLRLSSFFLFLFLFLLPLLLPLLERWIFFLSRARFHREESWISNFENCNFSTMSEIGMGWDGI